MTDLTKVPDDNTPVPSLDLQTLNKFLKSKEQVSNFFSETKIVIVAVILVVAMKFVPDTIVPFHWKVAVFAILLFIFGRCRKENNKR